MRDAREKRERIVDGRKEPFATLVATCDRPLCEIQPTTRIAFLVEVEFEKPQMGLQKLPNPP
jgi:hypothetical protein